MSRKNIRTILRSMAMLMLLPTLYSVLIVFSFLFLERDPFDRFEVISVKPNDAKR